MLFINNHQMAEAASDVTAEPTEAERLAKRYPSLAELIERLADSSPDENPPKHAYSAEKKKKSQTAKPNRRRRR
jgi:hypothetical protein